MKSPLEMPAPMAASPTPSARAQVERIVARQLALVGRRHGLTPAQENACRRTIPHYAALELAAVDLRRRAETFRGIRLPIGPLAYLRLLLSLPALEGR